MIRQYEPGDESKIELNDFVFNFDLLKAHIDNPEYYKSTVVAGDKVMAIIAFRPYWERCFDSFFMITRNMPLIHARELKQYLHDAIVDFNAERVQTDSLDCPTLNRWHEFLGFTLEGTRRKLVYGKDFNCWSIVNG